MGGSWAEVDRHEDTDTVRTRPRGGEERGGGASASLAGRVRNETSLHPLQPGTLQGPRSGDKVGSAGP